ncbi:unnamed protein product, partial [Vitis vinifera]|uniref:Uncharacterized protein n=1 Tax=Vitis vinifera TaxID=29760 RepID=D7SXZ6_VITVI
MFNLKFYISEGIQDSWMSLQQYFSYPEAIHLYCVIGINFASSKSNIPS